MASPRQSVRAVRDQDTLAGRLNEQRQVDELSQAALAERFGCSQQTIGAWEAGKRPQAKHFAALADYLGLPGPDDVAALLRANDGRGGDHSARPAGDESSLRMLAQAWATRIASGAPMTDNDLRAYELTLARMD